MKGISNISKMISLFSMQRSFGLNMTRMRNGVTLLMCFVSFSCFWSSLHQRSSMSCFSLRVKDKSGLGYMLFNKYWVYCVATGLIWSIYLHSRSPSIPCVHLRSSMFPCNYVFCICLDYNEPRRMDLQQKIKLSECKCWWGHPNHNYTHCPSWHIYWTNY